ncbi:MAG: hypothetical protein ACQEWU_20695 [Bacillota bacterium]|uniref:Uncharacterized protein n=1 Tax=Virgibacillus salarius TaxID=447199 RepID=A0A941DWX0_9BACI|nr:MULTISPECIES: hypothetical protein [Virgibacillus]MBR7798235.1 hypothetical protein [Virgibacillus salarius]MCC2252687.1 hypothetical protein [Virgibacillus sp. AGTR]NAZ10943.1 hypothetical protein [Agaribacter marinus]WBX80639.1 hypothetical protein PD280_01935 [Virgibacillus salarius]
MDKRLNQIKSDWNNDNIGIGSEEVKYLIQQAECVQELERKVERLKTRKGHLAYRLRVRRKQNPAPQTIFG